MIVLFSFFVLLKGLDKSNTYSPELSTTKIDFNFKAKDLFSDEEIFLDDLIKNDGMSLINIWASWCLPCRDEHAYLLNLKSLYKLNIVGINYKDSEINAKKFLKEFIMDYIKGSKLMKKNQKNENSFYWPRLKSDRDGLINWEWTAKEIVDFILAFSKPFNGAFAYINKTKVRIFYAKVLKSKVKFHPFQNGIIFKINKNRIL